MGQSAFCVGVGFCWLRAASASSSEFSADDGCGYCHIEAFAGRPVCWIVGNEQPLVDASAHFGGNALSLIAHHDDAVGLYILIIDVVAIEKCAIYRNFRRQGLQQMGKGQVVDMNSGNSSHGGLHHFGRKGIGCVR